jgi:hypothetical protein
MDAAAGIPIPVSQLSDLGMRGKQQASGSGNAPCRNDFGLVAGGGPRGHRCGFGRESEAATFAR